MFSRISQSKLVDPSRPIGIKCHDYQLKMQVNRVNTVNSVRDMNTLTGRTNRVKKNSIFDTKSGIHCSTIRDVHISQTETSIQVELNKEKC